MKYSFALYLFALSLIIVKSQTPVVLTSVLTKTVPSNGMLIFDASGFNFPLYNGRFVPGTLNLVVTNQKSQKPYSLNCFLYQFEGRLNLGTPKVGCVTKNLEEGEYTLEPFADPINFREARTNFALQPFSGTLSFSVFTGSELYFYEDDVTPDEEFEYRNDYEDTDFTLFEYSQRQTTTTIYFDNIPVTCYTFGAKLRCSLRADQFQQVRYKEYTVNIKDSANNLKRNYFVNPFLITLEYL